MKPCSRYLVSYKTALLACSEFDYRNGRLTSLYPVHLFEHWLCAILPGRRHFLVFGGKHQIDLFSQSKNAIFQVSTEASVSTQNLSWKLATQVLSLNDTIRQQKLVHLSIEIGHSIIVQRRAQNQLFSGDLKGCASRGMPTQTAARYYTTAAPSTTTS